MTRNLVVVGIDDSNASQVAMEWAADHARMNDAKLKAIYVRPARLPHRTRPEAMFTKPADDSVEDCDRQIRAIFYSVRPEVDWVLATAHGSTGAVLVKAAEQAIALVVGSRQMAGFEGILNPSVSHYCALHAQVPVVICPSIDEIGLHQTEDHPGAAEVTSPPPRSTFAHR